LLKKKIRANFEYANVDDVSVVMRNAREIEEKYPKFMAFLEWYCGYNRPSDGGDAQEICYGQGKRDVILLIKTLQRDDIDPDMAVKEFIRNREGEF